MKRFDGHTRGYILCFSAVILWSATAVLIKYLLENYTLDPLTLTFWRNVFASGTLAVALRALRPDLIRVARQDVWLLLLYGLSLASANISWTMSVALNGAAVSTILVYASPGVTALASHVFFQEPLSRLTVLALALAFAGCVLVAGGHGWSESRLTAAGIIAGVVSAVSFSAYTIVGKISLRRRINCWSGTLYAFAVATVITGLAQYKGNLFSLGYHIDGWLLVLLLAAIPTLGGFGLFTASLEHLPAGTASLIVSLEPVLAAIAAYLVLRESLVASQVLGGGMIVVSVVVASKWTERRQESQPSDGKPYNGGTMP